MMYCILNGSNYNGARRRRGSSSFDIRRPDARERRAALIHIDAPKCTPSITKKTGFIIIIIT